VYVSTSLCPSTPLSLSPHARTNTLRYTNLVHLGTPPLKGHTRPSTPSFMHARTVHAHTHRHRHTPTQNTHTRNLHNLHHDTNPYTVTCTCGGAYLSRGESSNVRSFFIEVFRKVGVLHAGMIQRRQRFNLALGVLHKFIKKTQKIGRTSHTLSGLEPCVWVSC
jgi:hypothetical protein